MQLTKKHKTTAQFLVLVLLAFFSFLMLEITLRYIPASSTASFLQIKQTEVTGLWYYLPVFYMHVYSSVCCLVAGFTQFSPALLKKRRSVHRAVGYLYVGVVLLFSAPTGFIMGMHANGGWVVVLFFTVLSVLWWGFTWQAVTAAKKKDFRRHRFMMIRSYALALSAITLRLWKWVLVQLFHPAPMDVYVVVAGLGWVPNWLCAEYIIYKIRSK
ncbi:DUF2306 domain-containing protein [Niabella drilacis]|uniref:Uncharacterized membrane protein n=1 Tax=Niabella drilacis (strain DSM 25811 / CCM 8410 / CCUG 62505 / LMG 26954 / E90) TaxID=1285928 RepID=A0A1G6ZPZ1_NIADE|nr:DUF2306 domain-containing protein [Niabella drilacis]SDE04591.1 Uncharacterized membrane protein [Niabella drilacis]